MFIYISLYVALLAEIAPLNWRTREAVGICPSVIARPRSLHGSAWAPSTALAAASCGSEQAQLAGFVPRDGKKKETSTKFGECRRKKRRQPPGTVASLRLFLRSSTGPNRPFQPQSLGRVYDPVGIAEGRPRLTQQRNAATSASFCGWLTICSQSVGRGKGHVERMGNAGSSRSTRRKLDQRHDSARSTRFARRAFRSR